MTSEPQADQIALRLSLLETSGQTSPAAARLALLATERLVNQLSPGTDREDTAALVVHLTLALGRAERGEPAPEVPDAVRIEVSAYGRELAQARALLAELSAELGHPVPEEEAYYVTAHMCALARRDAG